MQLHKKKKPPRLGWFYISKSGWQHWLSFLFGRGTYIRKKCRILRGRDINARLPDADRGIFQHKCRLLPFLSDLCLFLFGFIFKVFNHNNRSFLSHRSLYLTLFQSGIQLLFYFTYTFTTAYDYVRPIVEFLFRTYCAISHICFPSDNPLSLEIHISGEFYP